MGCAVGEGIAICAPHGNRYRTVAWCHNCQRRRRMLVTLYVWYDPIEVCCMCGDSYSGGYRASRPARRGWRQEAHAKLSQEWLAETGTKRSAISWVMNQVDKERGAA